jgi:hypothetical protein
MPIAHLQIKASVARMSEATSKSTPMRPYPFGLLRPHRDRPSRRRPAEQRDEVAASDVSCHLILPAGRLRPNDSTVEGAFPQEGLSVSIPLAYLAAYVAASAYPAGRVHPAVPPDEGARAALWRAVAA